MDKLPLQVIAICCIVLLIVAGSIVFADTSMYQDGYPHDKSRIFLALVLGIISGYLLNQAKSKS